MYAIRSYYEAKKGQKVLVREVDDPEPGDGKGEVAEVAPPSAAAGSGEVVVRVGPLGWHTIDAGPEAPALVALRRVETPDGARVQGFEVKLDALGDLLVEGRITSYNVCYTKLLRWCSPCASTSSWRVPASPPATCAAS